jgi:uncharacterized repeat protein (TIGR01451 family)
MRRPYTKSSFFITLISLALLQVTLMPALAADSVSITTVALKEVVVIDEQGKKESKRVPVEQALPGETAVFVNTVKNNTDKTVSGVVVNNPIPANMLYSDGSASGTNAALTFSVDGGKSYGIPGRLFVLQPDGKPRQAGPEDFTHIRWILLSPLAPQASQQIEFQAIVK